ncbi:MAG: HEAT repeat domain-containing protein [Acidobacteria bacterium]|nr:HEAT repeat domain-containing protein [Acidobacteriota bacterium]
MKIPRGLRLAGIVLVGCTIVLLVLYLYAIYWLPFPPCISRLGPFLVPVVWIFGWAAVGISRYLLNARYRARREGDASVMWLERSPGSRAAGGIALRPDRKPSHFVSFARRDESMYIWRPGYTVFILFPTFLAFLVGLFSLYVLAVTPFCGLGPEPESLRRWTPSGLRELSSECRLTRESAARELGCPSWWFGTYATRVEAALLDALKDPSEAVRTAAASSLARVGNKSERLVGELVQFLQSGDPTIRASAASALSTIGPAAKMAIPALKVAVRDSNWDVHFLAIQALVSIGPAPEDMDRALQRATRELESGAITDRIAAAFTLGRMSQAGVPALRDALQDTNPNVRETAVRSLGVIGPEAGGVVHRLIAMIRNREEEESVKSAAIESLCLVARDDPVAIQAIIEASHRPPQYLVGWIAGDALRRLGWRIEQSIGTPSPPQTWPDLSGIVEIEIRLAERPGKVEPPELTNWPDLQITMAKAPRRCRGSLLIEARTDADGNVVDARFIQRFACAPPWPELDDAFLGAMRRLKFRPILLNGEPEPVVFTATVSYLNGRNVL